MLIDSLVLSRLAHALPAWGPMLSGAAVYKQWTGLLEWWNSVLDSFVSLF